MAGGRAGDAFLNSNILLNITYIKCKDCTYPIHVLRKWERKQSVSTSTKEITSLVGDFHELQARFKVSIYTELPFYRLRWIKQSLRSSAEMALRVKSRCICLRNHTFLQESHRSEGPSLPSHSSPPAPPPRLPAAEKASFPHPHPRPGLPPSPPHPGRLGISDRSQEQPQRSHLSLTHLTQDHLGHEAAHRQPALSSSLTPQTLLANYQPLPVHMTTGDPDRLRLWPRITQQ